MAASETTDMGIGLAALLSSIAVIAAVALYLFPHGAIAGWGFAVAVVAGSLAVAAIHAYE